MAEMILREAVAKGLREALEDDRVFIMGEDIGAYGGAYAVTRGFLDEYGPERIMDTPISESVIVGAGVGSALAGLKPIVELMTINFSLVRYRPDCKPRGETSLHVRRTVHRSACHSDGDWRWRTACGHAFAELRELVRIRPRPEGSGASNTL